MPELPDESPTQAAEATDLSDKDVWVRVFVRGSPLFSFQHRIVGAARGPAATGWARGRQGVLRRLARGLRVSRGVTCCSTRVSRINSGRGAHFTAGTLGGW